MQNIQEQVLYVCNNNFIFEYNVKFDQTEIIKQINNLFNENLEAYYVQNDNVITKNNTYSHIINCYELVVSLKRIFIENKTLDFSEILDLIRSNNTPMRTPQTLMAISKIISNFSFNLINKTDINNYKTLIKLAYLKGIVEQLNYNYDLVSIAKKNRKVLNNLRITLPNEQQINYQKTITM